MTTREAIESKLEQQGVKCASLWAENRQLREQLQPSAAISIRNDHADSNGFLDQTSPACEKVELFQQLFRGRVDVYPLRWENKKGKSGYSPASVDEWIPVLCGKPRVKCAQYFFIPYVPFNEKNKWGL